MASWCAWRDSNPHAETPAPQAGLSTNSSTRTYGTQDGTRTHRKLILNQPRLPIAPLEHNSQDLGFLREPNTKLRRSFNTTWYSRWDSNPQHLPPEDSASANCATTAYEREIDSAGTPFPVVSTVEPFQVPVHTQSKPGCPNCLPRLPRLERQSLMAPDAGLEPTNLGSEPSVLLLD